MKAFLVLTESEALRELERALLAAGDRGFTILPSVLGLGRTGLKAGNRIHPGSTGLLLTVVPDAEADATAAFLRDVRDRAGARESTKIYVLPAEEIG